MDITSIEEFERYHRYLQAADPEELIMIGVERYLTEALGVAEDLMTGGDIVSILRSMANEEDLTLKNKGGWVQIIAMGRPKIKKRLILDCEAARKRSERPRRWQRKIILENQARTGELYGDAG